MRRKSTSVAQLQTELECENRVAELLTLQKEIAMVLQRTQHMLCCTRTWR